VAFIVPMMTRYCRGRILGEKIGSRYRDNRNPELLKHVMPGQLHGKIASEAVGRLHDDCLRTVSSEVLQHFSKAAALIDRVRALALDGRVKNESAGLLIQRSRRLALSAVQVPLIPINCLHNPSEISV
jgi:hypothetical protein